MTVITPFPVSTMGDALHVVNAARKSGLRASYHPHGGHTAKKSMPVLHTVYVSGTPEQIHKLRLAMAKESNHGKE